MSATGARATPTQKRVMDPTMRPTPPTTKPASPIMTAVQAAGVLPWLSAMVGDSLSVRLRDAVLSRPPGHGECILGGRGARRIRRVASLVERLPQVGVVGLGRPVGRRCVVPAAHGRPAG